MEIQREVRVLQRKGMLEASDLIPAIKLMSYTSQKEKKNENSITCDSDPREIRRTRSSLVTNVPLN